MNPLEVIRRVESHWGSLRVDGNDLQVAAPAPLSDELLAQVAECKPAIMIALGAPIDATGASILNDIRPYLAPALKRLPDDRLLALVNWHIVAAWNASVRHVAHPSAAGRTRR